MVETMASSIPENGIIDADELIDAARDNDEDFDYWRHAKELLRPAGFVLLAQSDEVLDDIDDETLRGIYSEADEAHGYSLSITEAVQALRDTDGVQSLVYRTWNRDFGRNDDAAVYYCDPADLPAVAERFRQALEQA